MNRSLRRILTLWLFFAGIVCPAQVLRAAQNASFRLPDWTYPEITEGLWADSEFQPDGYKPFLDLVATHSPFNMVLILTAHTSEVWREVTEPAVHDQLGRAVAYAHSLGLRMVLDLDVRLARSEFRREHPDQLQWMLRVRSVPITSAGGHFEIDPPIEQDHMTGPKGSYVPLDGKLVRVYLAGKNTEGGLKDITAVSSVSNQSRQGVALTIPPGVGSPGDQAVVATAFKYLYPDVFAPTIIDYQRNILVQYRDTHMDGALKEEWGFPPIYNEGVKIGDFWYSKPFAAAYAKAGGGDFIHDCVLMALGLGGSYTNRIADVNRYEHLILTRNVEIEQAFYQDVKNIFGPQAFVGTHTTWGYMPTGDAVKDGYDWWGARRDFDQSDEDWSVSVRTSLAKKMGQPLWYHQYYNQDTPAFFPMIWQGARRGGRINFLCYPFNYTNKDYERILTSDLIRAETRILLLNFVTRAPAESPVAVVFGHIASLNWVGPSFEDLGWDYAREMGELGFPADVIPSSEIQAGALRLGDDGLVTYGEQRYHALVFLNPEYEPAGTFDFLRLAARSRTIVFLRGTSEYNFDGTKRNPEEARVPGAGLDATPSRVAEYLYGQTYPPGNIHPMNARDITQLTDGTCIIARGYKDPSGDDIDESFYCGRRDTISSILKIQVHAKGVLAIRLSSAGKVESLAGSDLRQVDVGDFHLRLSEPIDFALWQNQQGRRQGAIQDRAEVPRALLDFTTNWTHLTVAPPP